MVWKFWDLKNLIILGIGFQMEQILVWDIACMKYDCDIEKCLQKL